MSKIYEELELELAEIFSVFSKKYNDIDFDIFTMINSIQ